MNSEKKKRRGGMPPRYILYFMILFCLIMLGVDYVRPGILSPVTELVNQALAPLQKSINLIGSGVSDTAGNYRTLQELQAEYKILQEENEHMKQEIAQYQEGQKELEQLRTLFSLSKDYSQYEMTGARVIQKDAGNWYHSFVIDKGSADGIQTDMNVIADGGLVGIVTTVGENYAKVRSIIDDDSSVSAMSMNSGDTCIVSGDLELFDQGKLMLSHIDKNDNVWDDDKIVTSNISSKFLPGILIGYAADMKVDTNNITKSGYVIPVVDFAHLQNVLVIMTTKETGEEQTE